MPAPAATPRPFRAAGATEALRVLALGANLFAITLIFPVMHGGTRGLADQLVLPLPLVPLAIGVYALLANRTQRHRDLAVATLLFGFPVTLAAVIAMRADLSDRDAWGPLGLLAGAASLLAFGAVSAEACARPLALRTSTAQGVGAARETTDPKARRYLRRAVLTIATIGALLAAVVAPALGSRATLVRLWGDAADEATVLASIVGAAAGAGGIAALLGPRLRAPRPTELLPESQRAIRVGVALLLAVLALAGLLLLRAFEGTSEGAG